MVQQHLLGFEQILRGVSHVWSTLMQIQENMKAINVIPMLTPAVMEKIEAIVQSKPKRQDSYR